MGLNKRAILAKAYSRWGFKAQYVLAMEEMGELIQELSKWYRGKRNWEKLWEEIADVELTLEGIKQFTDGFDSVKIIKKEKLERLKDRLNKKY